VERNQIEEVLGLTGLVSLTDHDTISAPTLLRVVEETSRIPFALESCVLTAATWQQSSTEPTHLSWVDRQDRSIARDSHSVLRERCRDVGCPLS